MSKASLLRILVVAWSFAAAGRLWGIDGEIDRTFQRAIFPTALEIRAIAVAKNGTVYTGGPAQSVNSSADYALHAFNKKGVRNAKFIPEGMNVGEVVHDLAATPDGKLLVATQQRLVRRLLATGRVDTKFTPDVTITTEPSDVHLAVAPDGNILIGGDFVAEDAVGNTYHGLVRLKPDGTVDTTFTVQLDDGSYLTDLEIDPAGGIWYTGSVSIAATGYDGTCGRFDSSGFADEPLVTGDVPTAIAPLSHGPVLVAFSSATTGPTVVQYQRDGAVDAAWMNPPLPGTDAFEIFTELVPQADGKVLAGGSFSYQGGTRHLLVRFLADGSRDLGFVGYCGSLGSVNEIVLQPDGKILVGGDFEEVDGEPWPKLVRLQNNLAAGWGVRKGSVASGAAQGMPLIGGKTPGASLPFVTGWYYVTSFGFHDDFVFHNSNCFLYLEANFDTARVREVVVPAFGFTPNDPKVQELGTGATYSPDVGELPSIVAELAAKNTQRFPTLVWAPGTTFRTFVHGPDIIAFKAEGHLAAFTQSAGSQDQPEIEIVPGGPYKAIPGTPVALGSNVGQMYSGFYPGTQVPYDGVPRILQFVTAKKNKVSFYMGMFLVTAPDPSLRITEADVEEFDKTPPRVSFKFPPAARMIDSESVTLAGTVTETCWLSRIEWRLGGGPWTRCYGGQYWSALIRGLQPGKNVIEVQGIDGAGNRTSPPAKITLKRRL